MAQDRWTIENDRNSPRIGNDLNGLHIRKSESGYELVAVLGTTNASHPPFDFNDVRHDGRTWSLHLAQLPPQANGRGHWEISPSSREPGGDPNDGDFTAMSGPGADEDADDAASSANA